MVLIIIIRKDPKIAPLDPKIETQKKLKTSKKNKIALMNFESSFLNNKKTKGIFINIENAVILILAAIPLKI